MTHESDQYFLDRSAPLEGEKTPDSHLTPEKLLEMNNSPLAVARREEFDQRRAEGSQGLIWVCDDSRVWRGDSGSVYFNTIANGGSVDQVRGAINSPSVQFGLVIGHGPDCGGRTARHAHVTNGAPPARSGISGFIDQQVEDHTNLQGVRKAARLATLSDKLTAAAYQNHLTGKIDVFAVFNRKDGGPESHLQLHTVLQRPTPATVPFDAELPALAFDELPEELQDHLRLLEKNKQEELARHPELLKDLITQRPPVVKVGDNLRSAEVWAPDIAYPGQMFRMSIPRTRERDQAGQKRTRYSTSDLDHLGNQLEYPMHYAVANRHNPEAGFSNTRTLLIALSDMKRAEQVARELVERSYMAPWLADERNQVLLAENQAGILTRATRINYKVRDGEVAGYEVENYRKA